MNKHHSEEVTMSQSHSVLAPIRFEHFYLAERADRDTHPALPAGSGLAVVSPGQIRCTVGPLTEWASLVTEIHDQAPPNVTDDYEDVVERSFYCASGELSVLDWMLRLVHVLPPLREGPHRLRYHMRNMDDSGSPSTGPSSNVGEVLLQIWPAQPAAAAELKISSSTGRFWHPFATFRKPKCT